MMIHPDSAVAICSLLLRMLFPPTGEILGGQETKQDLSLRSRHGFLAEPVLSAVEGFEMTKGQTGAGLIPRLDKHVERFRGLSLKLNDGIPHDTPGKPNDFH